MSTYSTAGTADDPASARKPRYALTLEEVDYIRGRDPGLLEVIDYDLVYRTAPPDPRVLDVGAMRAAVLGVVYTTFHGPKCAVRQGLGPRRPFRRRR